MTSSSRGETAPAHTRRFPHLTGEDLDVLAALAPDQAREFENFLLQQHRRDRGDLAAVATSVAGDLLERAHGAAAATWSHGAGGGRRGADRAARPLAELRTRSHT